MVEKSSGGVCGLRVTQMMQATAAEAECFLYFQGEGYPCLSRSFFLFSLGSQDDLVDHGDLMTSMTWPPPFGPTGGVRSC
jgi:hypothetical protein